MGTIVQDIRFAVRQLRKHPGFSFTAIFVFALGVAASTAIFAFVDAALVTPLPYRDPSRLVALYERVTVGDRYHLSGYDYLAWKHLNRSFTSLDVYRPDKFALTSGNTPEVVAGTRVSDGFFGALGVTPFLGRDFKPGEDAKSAAPVVILSYTAWQKRFAGDRGVLGRSVTLDGTPEVVIGVLPRGFHFAPVEPAEFWSTLHGLCDDMPHDCHALYGVARLKEGLSVAAAVTDLTPIAAQISAQYPNSNRDRSAMVIPLVDAILGEVRPTLVALLAGAALLCLIGFVNVSSLLLVRAEGRRREIAVRGALGAGRARLALQFTVEGFLLAGSGCFLGLLLAWLAIGTLHGWIPPDLMETMPYLQHLHLHWHVFAFACGVSLLGALLFSAGPSLQLWVSDMQDGLMEGGRTAASRSWSRVGRGLVMVELAITVVLLASAGLLAKSFYRLLHEDIGMAADHLAALHVSRTDTSTDAANVALQRHLLADMSALPGVRSAGISSRLAVGGGEAYVASFEYFRVVGRPFIGGGDEATDRIASTGYLETLRARLLEGRYFTESDDASRPNVAIINRTFAKQLFPDEDPIGKQLVGVVAGSPAMQIIGVIDDIKEGPLDSKPVAGVYEPFNQAPLDDFFVTVRTTQSAASILPLMAQAVQRIDRGLILGEEETMADRINRSESAYLHRSASWLIAAFAALALLLGTVGLYGVIAYSVGQRTREIGVRMALGAQRASVYRLILREACWLAAVGITGGILCSFVATRLLRSMLFGVSPRDSGTAISVVLVLAASALAASFIPARRAASIDPATALRTE